MHSLRLLGCGRFNAVACSLATLWPNRNPPLASAARAGEAASCWISASGGWWVALGNLFVLQSSHQDSDVLAQADTRVDFVAVVVNQVENAESRVPARSSMQQYRPRVRAAPDHPRLMAVADASRAGRLDAPRSSHESKAVSCRPAHMAAIPNPVLFAL